MPDSDPVEGALHGFGANSVDGSARTRSDLDQYLRGDGAAFDRIWLRFLPGLEVLVRGKIRVAVDASLRARLDAEIDDLLQEIAQDALERVRSFEYRGPGSLLAWLRNIAERRVLDRADYWRAGKRAPRFERQQRAVSDSAGASRSAYGADVRDRAPGPFTQLAKLEERERVARAMSTLSERHHSIAWLRCFAGADWSEIAADVDAPSADSVRMEFTLKVLPALVQALKTS